MPRGKGLFDGPSGRTYESACVIIRKQLKANISLHTIAQDEFDVSKQAVLTYLKLWEKNAGSLGESFPTTEKIEQHATELGLDNSDHNFRLSVTDLLGAPCKKIAKNADDAKKVLLGVTEWAFFVKENITIGVDDTVSRAHGSIMAQLAEVKAKLEAKIAKSKK